MVKTFFLNLSLNKKLILMMLVMTAVLLVIGFLVLVVMALSCLTHRK